MPHPLSSYATLILTLWTYSHCYTSSLVPSTQNSSTSTGTVPVLNTEVQL